MTKSHSHRTVEEAWLGGTRRVFIIYTLGSIWITFLKGPLKSPKWQFSLCFYPFLYVQPERVPLPGGSSHGIIHYRKYVPRPTPPNPKYTCCMYVCFCKSYFYFSFPHVVVANTTSYCSWLWQSLSHNNKIILAVRSALHLILRFIQHCWSWSTQRSSYTCYCLYTLSLHDSRVTLYKSTNFSLVTEPEARFSKYPVTYGAR